MRQASPVSDRPQLPTGFLSSSRQACQLCNPLSMPLDLVTRGHLIGDFCFQGPPITIRSAVPSPGNLINDIRRSEATCEPPSLHWHAAREYARPTPSGVPCGSYQSICAVCAVLGGLLWRLAPGSSRGSPGAGSKFPSNGSRLT